MDKVEIQKLDKLRSGISCIDSLMDGGLEPGIITEIFGEGGAGKTNLCMVFSLSALLAGERVIYLDSEGFSSERFLQLTRSAPEVLPNFSLYRIGSLEDQEISLMRVSKTLEKKKHSLVIIDSFTEHFRLEKTGDPSRYSILQKQLSLVQGIASKFTIPVLITNQIYLDIDSGNLSPFGGFVMDHVMKAIYRIDKLKDGKRTIMVTKHRSIGEGRRAEFYITGEGLSCIQTGNDIRMQPQQIR